MTGPTTAGRTSDPQVAGAAAREAPASPPGVAWWRVTAGALREIAGSRGLILGLCGVLAGSFVLFGWAMHAQDGVVATGLPVGDFLNSALWAVQAATVALCAYLVGGPYSAGWIHPLLLAAPRRWMLAAAVVTSASYSFVFAAGFLVVGRVVVSQPAPDPGLVQSLWRVPLSAGLLALLVCGLAAVLRSALWPLVSWAGLTVINQLVSTGPVLLRFGLPLATLPACQLSATSSPPAPGQPGQVWCWTALALWAVVCAAAGLGRAVNYPERTVKTKEHHGQ